MAALRYHGSVSTEGSSDAFAGYLAYHSELAGVLSDVAAGAALEPLDATAHLDGLAYHRFRQSVPVETRRSFSTFFTSSGLRAQLVAPYRNVIRRGATVLDPACGVGDL